MTSAGGNREGVGRWSVVGKTGAEENPDVAQGEGVGGDGGSILMRHQQRRGADSLDRRLPAPVMMLHALGSKLPWASFPGNFVTVLGPLPLSFPRGLLDAAIPSPLPPLVSEEAYSSPVALSMPPAWLLTQAAGLMSMDACGCRLSVSLMPSYPLWSLLPPRPQPPPPPLSVFEHGSGYSQVYFLNNLGI